MPARKHYVLRHSRLNIVTSISCFVLVSDFDIQISDLFVAASAPRSSRAVVRAFRDSPTHLSDLARATGDSRVTMFLKKPCFSSPESQTLSPRFQFFFRARRATQES